MTLSEMEKQVCDWIETQHKSMLEEAILWSSINSGTFHREGVNAVGEKLIKKLQGFSADVHEHDIKPYLEITATGEYKERPLGKLITAVKAPEAPYRALLSGHLDTVFEKNHPFQSIRYLDNNQVEGPGIIDLKSGLVIMTTAIAAIERLKIKEFGWTVVLSSDEEVGSASSAPFLIEHAKHTQLGLVFEPPYTDGAFVNERGSSAYYVILAKGRSAHVGRHYTEGRSAIKAAARLVEPLEKLNSDAVTLNVGSIDGGSPSNVVPALALIRINVRTKTLADHKFVNAKLEEIVRQYNGIGDVSLSLVRGAVREPKPFDNATKHLFSFVKECCEELHIPVAWRRSGGVCDGNILAAAGLPTIDSLGARGGGIHTANEYLQIESLTERTKLTALILLRFANKQYIPILRKEKVEK